MVGHSALMWRTERADSVDIGWLTGRLRLGFLSHRKIVKIRSSLVRTVFKLLESETCWVCLCKVG